MVKINPILKFMTCGSVDDGVHFRKTAFESKTSIMTK